MEKMTVTLEGVTYAFEIESNEAKVHITLAAAFAALGLDVSEFKLVPATQTVGFAGDERTEIAV